MSKTSPHVAEFSGDLKVGEITIPCHVLEDGKRLISGRGVTNAMGLTGRGQGVSRFIDAKSLRPFIPESLVEAIKEPIDFVPAGGGKAAQGFEAWVLPELCSAVLDADKAGLIKPQQESMVAHAHVLLRAFAVVGIVSLVDEATGYQKVRARKALEEILDKFIAKELRSWTKTFPDEFYEEMFRLRGWPYQPWSVARPSIVGRYTTNLVYERMAPGVRSELERKNPTTSPGTRKHRHHQWLTEDVGHPKLREHLASVITLMKASANWDQFQRLINRSLPRYGDTFEMMLDDE